MCKHYLHVSARYAHLLEGIGTVYSAIWDAPNFYEASSCSYGVVQHALGADCQSFSRFSVGMSWCIRFLPSILLGKASSLRISADMGVIQPSVSTQCTFGMASVV